MKKNIIKILVMIVANGIMFSGCVATQSNVVYSKNQCYERGMYPEVFADGSILCIDDKKLAEENSKNNLLEKQKREKQKLEHFASYEKNYLSEYYNILEKTPELKTTYIQPMNKKEPCKIWFEYSEDNQWFKEESYKIF